jgi:hypothetical protein
MRMTNGTADFQNETKNGFCGAGIYPAENLLSFKLKPPEKRKFMPRGDKSSYTSKQKRQAEHIEEGYESRGLKPKESKRRAWATVNKMTHGGKRSGSGRGRTENHEPARKGGRLGGRARSRRMR